MGPDQVSEPSEEVSETEEVCWLWTSEANDGIARPVSTNKRPGEVGADQ